MAMVSGPMTPRQLARDSELGLLYVYALLQSGRLPAVKIDGHWQIEPEVAREFIKARRCRQARRKAQQHERRSRCQTKK